MLPQPKNGISPSRESSRRRHYFYALFPCVLVLLVCSQLLGPFNPPPVSAKSRANPNPPLSVPSWLKPSTPAQPPVLGQPVTGHPNTTPVPIPHPQAKPQAPVTVHLTTSAQQVESSDGHFVISVPAGAVSSSQIQAAGGTLWLKVTQTDGGSGGGQSGRLFLGTYQVQFQDAAGKPVTNLVLAHPFTLQYRQLAHDSLVLAQDQVVDALLNSTPTTTTSGAASTAIPSVTSAGQPAKQAPHMLIGRKDAHNASWSVTTTLSNQATATGGATPNATGQATPAAAASTITFSTNAPQASWGTTQNFDVGLNAGSLNYSYPLSVPPGPGNFTPNLGLSYSSGSINESHNVQAAAPWLGEGWNLSMGSITWSQHNVTPGGTNNWENVWYLNDPSGISGQLIPPDLNATTAAPTVPAMSSLPAQYIWHTAPESHAKVQEVNFNGQPCWHVWLPDGTLEEFGCTDPARQTALDAHGQSNPYAWDLNLIVDPHGNQIRINYTQFHIQTTGMRDAFISSIEYDDPTCHNRSYPSGSATAGCTTWNPQVRLVFDASTTVTNLANPTGGCQNWTTAGFRCDDAVDLSGSGGLPIANVMSIYVLNDIKVEVQGNTLNEYVFSYNQGKPQTITDPLSGLQESVAGYLLLTQIQQLGTGGPALNAPVTITYTEQTQHYEDLAFYATPSTNCGPSWTPRNSNGCLLWEQSYNSYYIQTYDNGAGWHENITWKEARNNTHGVDSGVATNTFTCDGQEAPGALCGRADDENWSRVVVLSRSSVTNNVTSTWSYQYNVNTLSAKPCLDCGYGYTWGNQNDNDFADYYNGQFTSFANATVTQPDGSYQIDYFASTIGWGLAESSITCDLPSGSCNVAPYWNQDPGMAGKLKGEQDYNASGQLMQVKNLTYAMNCPPTGVAHSNNASGPPFNPGNTELISELDQNNPVVVCDPRVTQEDDYQIDGVTGINNFQTDARVLHKTITTTYDGNNQGVSAYDYGNVNKVDTTANDVAGAHFVTQTSYYPNDNLGGGIYLTNLPVFTATLDGSGTYYACTASVYGANTSAPQAPSTTDVAQSLDYVHPNGGCAAPLVTTAYTYDSSGNPLSMTDPDGHLGCTLGSSQYSTCAGYDTLNTHLTSATNAKNQTVSYQYNTSNAASGFGEWLLSTTDVNGHATTYTYDALGRVASITKPGDSTSTPTNTFTYNNSCSAGVTTPCLEIDTTSLVTFGSTKTTTTKQWYDGLGRLVETQTPGPNTISGNPSFIVTYTIYDNMGRATTKSLPYAITATGYVAPDLTQARTVTGYDSLGRSLGSVTYSNASTIVESSTINYTVAQGVPGFTGDSLTPFEQTVTLDAYNHEQIAFADALGRTRYAQVESGTGNPYTVVRTVQYNYDTLGDQTATNTYDSLSHLLAFHNATYNGLKQVTGWNDADSGACSNTPLPPGCSSSTDTAWKATYDNNGNVTSQTDPRGQTTYTSYDALNRPLCTGSSSATVNPCSSSASSISFYDSYGNSDNPTVAPPPCSGPPSQFASDPVGEKTSEIFSNAAGSGWRCFGYDDRGETDMSTLSITADSKATTQTVYADYTELGQVADLTYPDSEIVTSNFDNNGYFQGMSDANGAIVSNVLYTNAGQVAGMTIGGVVYQSVATTPVQVSYGYDAIQRPASTSASVNGKSIFSQTRTYDNVGNVITLNTTVPTTSGGSQTDNQAFCYDALDRLVWAGNNGTPTGGDHCGTAPSGSTTTAYQQAYSYDALDRLTVGPAGTTSYTDASHTHAATNVSTVPNQYASYDAMGNMTCRNVDTTTAHSCGSTPTGATMTYDTQGRLASWTAPSGTSAGEQFLYDNEGNRVLQRTVSTIGSTTTVNNTITFDGFTQTSIINGASPTTTKYYSAASQTVAMTDGSHWYTLVGDGLGSATLALKSDGTVQAVQLYTPFGSVRSTDGTMPTPRNYTGHLLDDAMGLLYYNARYYDPAAGTFLSTDSKVGNDQGANPYAYVGGNPETMTDPSGERSCPPDLSQCAGGPPYGNDPPPGAGGCNKATCTPPDGGNPVPNPNNPVVPPPPPPGKHGGDTATNPASACSATCQAKAKVAALSAAQQLERLAGQVQGIINGLTNCSDLAFNCLMQQVFADVGGSGAIGLAIGGIIGCLVTIAAGCIAGAGTGAVIGGIVGGVAGAGYLAYYLIVKHSVISMFQSVLGILNSGASDFEHQQLGGPGALGDLYSQEASFEEARGNFTANTWDPNSNNQANAVLGQADNIVVDAIWNELKGFDIY